jgi:hypothetical protein
MSDIDQRWRRPETGQTTVFLSYHARDVKSAIATRTALEKSKIKVLLYDPDNRWPDAALEILQRILNEAHCVVYVGRRWFKSPWVRVEIHFARRLGLKVFQISGATRAKTIIPTLKRLGSIPPIVHGPIFIRQYMDEALLDNLDPKLVIRSQTLERWRVMMQKLNYHPALNYLGHFAPLSTQFHRFIARLKRRAVGGSGAAMAV